MRRRPPPQIARRPGSKADRIERWLRREIRTRRGTPSSFAAAASAALHTPVQRSDISHALSDMGFTSKTWSIVPGLGSAVDRAAYLRQIHLLVTRSDQLVCIDEKKWKKDEFHSRFSSTGYSLAGQRLPRVMAPVTAIPNFSHAEVIGALGTVTPAPLLADATRIGTIGLLSFHLVTGALTRADIANFLTVTLPTCCGPYPGPRSVMIMDNMPTHRSIQAQIQTALFVLMPFHLFSLTRTYILRNARGALFI